MYLQKLPVYLINVVLHMILYFAFTMRPLRKYFRYSNRVTFGITAIVIGLFGIMDTVFFEKGAPLYDWQNLVLMLTLLMMLGYALLVVKRHYIQLVFIIVVCFCFHMGIIALPKVIVFAYPLPAIISWFPEFNDILWQLFFLAIFSLPMWYLSEKVFAKVIDSEIDFLQWRYTVLLPLAILGVSQVYAIYFMNKMGEGYLEIILILLFMLASYLAYMTVLKVLLIGNEKNAIEQERIVANRQIELQKINYSQLREHIALTARERHDFRHHYVAVKGFIDSGDIEGARAYMTKYDDVKPEEPPMNMCENKTINSLLIYNTSMAIKDGAKVTSQVVIPENCGVDDIELCVIVGNIVENAVDAVARQVCGDKYIDIKANIVGKQLIIIVTNSYSGEIKEKDGSIYSSKAENRIGIGIDSVRKMVAKIGGDINIEYKNSEFKAYIVLNLK